jgi:murein DD-endopeptidase MepM/ murein hydrolase activator NlpD
VTCSDSSVRVSEGLLGGLLLRGQLIDPGLQGVERRLRGVQLGRELAGTVGQLGRLLLRRMDRGDRLELGGRYLGDLVLLTAIREQKGTYEVELNALDGAADSIAVLLRSLGIAPGPVAPCDVRPVPGGITSPFGPRIDPITGNPGFHTGVDMQAAYGTPIRACQSRTVVIASPQGGYGNAVVINHTGGMATLYAHQSRIAVVPGQVVNAGDVIGYVGATGYATGPHLHFEVRLDGNPVNPIGFLP